MQRSLLELEEVQLGEVYHEVPSKSHVVHLWFHTLIFEPQASCQGLWMDQGFHPWEATEPRVAELAILARKLR